LGFFFFYSFYFQAHRRVYGISLMRRERRKAIDQTFLRHKPVGDETMKKYMYIRKKLSLVRPPSDLVAEVNSR
jgi:hypothetical protein